MLKLIYSNNMIELAARLVDAQQSQPLSPFSPETVVVQSNELARWLSLYLAQRHGIASHIDFPYPSAFIWSLFRQLLPDIPTQSAFSTDAMAWRIFEIVPNCRKQTGFEPIDAYLGDGSDDLKCYELAHRIADTFDQYLMYRPDWVQAWEQGEKPHWQARLWQLVTKGESAPQHRANLLSQLKTYLSATEIKPAALSERIAIFGLSALPPVYLELFELMSRHCDIQLFFLSPSERYWGDLVSPRTQSKQALQADDEQYLTVGHPLLASLGKQGQDFFEQLQSCDTEETSYFTKPKQDSLLAKLHYDIYALTDIDNTGDKQKIAVDDDSIMVHSCHSEMREIEVLHDQLLALFEQNPDLSPTDVVVMTADIEIYSPWIEAVFSCADKQHYIPFSIADGGIKSQSALLTAFNSLLDLPQSRFEVESIMALLECEAIQHRFGFEQNTIDLIRRWLLETYTRWGMDASDKATLGLPESEANTWRAGLDRLLLGYALPESSEQLFDGKLGFDDISGERAETMAQLCAFIDCLERYRKRLQAQLTTSQWQQTILTMLDDLFLPAMDNSQQESELQQIRTTLLGLVETTELAGFEKTITIDLVKQWLDSHLDIQQSQTRFMGHGVTFCGMVPMRSIPFPVVCLIGMNDASFPRRQAKSGFDLLSHTPPRQGDRSQRDEDRYLFLESLLSAQSHLYISYVGASIYDNATIPPSVLVSDMRDVLRLSFETSSGDDIWQQVFTQHPLQAFSRRYFDNSSDKLSSYVTAQCPPNEQVEHNDWFDQTLPEADAQWRNVSLEQLSSFYRHPARYLLQQRLGLWLERDEEQLESREPFELDSLQAWSLRQKLLDHRLNDQKLAEIEPIVQATGALPQGNIGDYIFNMQANKAEQFADTVLADYPDAFLEPLAFELPINDFTIEGQLEGLTRQGLFGYRMAKVKGGELITVWLRHLIMNCLKPAGVNYESHWITEDKDYHFQGVENAEALLGELLDLYWQGLHQPLPLFSNTSYVFAKASIKGNKTDSAMNNAWNGGLYASAEKDDLYYQQVYTDTPLDEQFEAIALTIYEPIAEHIIGGQL